jgi:hypothetical protein
MAAQPLRRRIGCRERKDPGRARFPPKRRDQRRKHGKEGKPAGKEQCHEWYLPGVFDWIDEEGIEDPVHADDELAKTKRPTDERGASEPLCALGGAVEQDDENRHAKQKQPKGIERLKSECGERARQKSRGNAAPACQAFQKYAAAKKIRCHAGVSATPGRLAGSRSRRRLMRRGSASRTSNS